MHIRKIRLSLQKDRNLVAKKDELKRIVESFEKTQKYIGHIGIDVDPA
jgi:hypothetical protein